LRNRFDIFRKRSQVPQTKPTGKTVVKITFEHEQHGGWPNEPDRARRRRAFWTNEPERVQCSEKSYKGRRTAGSTRSPRYPEAPRRLSKPGRIIAPGFALCAQKFVRRRRCYGSRAIDDASGERTAGEEMVSAPAYLGVQPVAEKIPVNFLLFTGKAQFRSPIGCAEMATT
jgi:hypothetical protein